MGLLTSRATRVEPFRLGFRSVVFRIVGTYAGLRRLAQFLADRIVGQSRRTDAIEAA